MESTLLFKCKIIKNILWGLATLLEGAGCFFNISKVNSQTFTLLWWKKCVKLAKNVKKVINKGIGTCFSEKIVVFGHILAEISENVILLHKNLNMYTKAYMMLLLLLTGSSCKEYIPGLFKDTCLAKKVVHLRSFWHRLNPKCQPHIIFKFFKLWHCTVVCKGSLENISCRSKSWL